eukprot:TRINITY_DN1516_c0_g2_i6.p2 TRINITY_DN1516_c0_g2~~TRINITY_DN1516_c0_g2_i6.p2  ORF type:complete len:471 (-),score=83.77 TRINITY_DN1516_c0_g2_i6:180-1592(-)
MVHDKFDLDLTYITERIIAMSIPGITPLLSVVCNPYSQVKGFLDLYHPNSYKVYNLCIEYPYKGEELFEGRYMYFPTEDMQPPSLERMYQFCIDAYQWLQKNSNNIVVIHCKGGKGRTGCMICALLTYLGVVQKNEYLEFSDPQRSLSHFATLRTVDRQGITRASQKKYVRNFGEIINQNKMLLLEMIHPIRLLMIKIFGLDEDLQRSGRMVVKVYFRAHGNSGSEKVARAEITSRNSGATKQEVIFKERNYRVWYADKCVVLDFAPIFESMLEQWITNGDVKISVKIFRPRPKTLFYLWFSTMIVPESGLAIANFEALDKPYKKMLANKENVQIELKYTKLEPVPHENQNLNLNLNFQQNQQINNRDKIWDLELSNLKQQLETKDISSTLEETINRLKIQQQRFKQNKNQQQQQFQQLSEQISSEHSKEHFDEDEYEEDEEEEEEEEEEVTSGQNDLLKFDDFDDKENL